MKVMDIGEAAARLDRYVTNPDQDQVIVTVSGMADS
jgi:hypothetical protein